ncbi:MAG: hypothetical protein Q9199_007284 [Rusavskia elegans]
MATAPFDVLTATASELEPLLASGKVTSVQLIEIYLAEIEKNNGYLKAVISTAPKNSLIEKANALDGERSSGSIRSQFPGLPILVKELSWYKGSWTICGWSAVGGQSQSAYVRGGIRDDDTFGGHSGGSSSGSAIAISAGLSPLALGTETEGPLIMPGNRAALYTMKPTIGIVSQQGIVPVSHICDAAGPMTKSVLDLAHVMDIIVDPTKTSVPPSGCASVMTDTWADIRRDEFEDAYKKIGRLAKTFQRYVPLPNGDDLEFNGADSLNTVWTGHFKEDFEKYTTGLENSRVYTLEKLVEFNRKHSEKELPPRYPKQDKLEKALATKFSTEILDATLQYARQVSRTKGIDKILEDYSLDVIIGPAESSMTDFASASGYPIASLPLGYLEFNGRPFGMAALVSAHQEATLIKVQSAWEATFPARRPPPRENFEAS